MLKTRLLVLGAGGHGCSVVEAAELSGKFEVVGFLDDSIGAGKSVLGKPILGLISDVIKHRSIAEKFFVAIGNNILRKSLMHQLAQSELECASVFHPSAIISPTARLGKGTVVLAGAIIGSEACLGIGSIINCGAVVDHHAIVEDFGHLGVNASMAGGAVLGRGAWMQSGSAIGHGVKIPEKSILQPCSTLKT